MTVVIFPEYSSPLKDLTLEQFNARLKEILVNRVQEVWLYGSVARGDATADSDIDLFIIANTSLPFHERGRDFDDLRDFNVNIEALVYTPEEWKKLTLAPTAGFWQSVTREMVRMV